MYYAGEVDPMPVDSIEWLARCVRKTKHKRQQTADEIDSQRIVVASIDSLVKNAVRKCGNKRGTKLYSCYDRTDGILYSWGRAISGSHRKMAAFGAACSEIEICDLIGRSMSRNEPTISPADGGAEAWELCMLSCSTILKKYFRLNGTHCDLDFLLLTLRDCARPLFLYWNITQRIEFLSYINMTLFIVVQCFGHDFFWELFS